MYKFQRKSRKNPWFPEFFWLLSLNIRNQTVTNKNPSQFWSPLAFQNQNPELWGKSPIKICFLGVSGGKFMRVRFWKKSHFEEILEVSAQCCPSKCRFTPKEWKFWGFVFCKKSTILNPQMKILNFYDGLYIDLRYQNMRLNEKIFTWSERQSVVVFEEVGGLEVKHSVGSACLSFWHVTLTLYFWANSLLRLLCLKVSKMSSHQIPDLVSWFCQPYTLF